jgi:dTDP-4-dehydrorhamnose 3,5-epimerase
MHLQRAPAQEYKLVRCLSGRVFDVAADLRRDSPSYGRWFALELSGDDHRSLLIPPGVAHGFQTLSDDVQLLYQHSSAYDAALDAGVRHDDPLLAIDWPLPVSGLSPRDRALPWLPPSAARAAA